MTRKTDEFFSDKEAAKRRAFSQSYNSPHPEGSQ